MRRFIYLIRAITELVVPATSSRRRELELSRMRYTALTDFSDFQIPTYMLEAESVARIAWDAAEYGASDRGTTAARRDLR